jgi:DNA polymerase III alpha subunit
MANSFVSKLLNMDKSTEIILTNRQILLDNVGDLHNKYKNHNPNQLSLFDNKENEINELQLKSNVNFNDLLNKEKEVLGICISYNRLIPYSLIRSKICNTNIGNVFDNKKNNDNLKFIGNLSSIKHMTAKSSGNKYAKLFFEDETGVYEFYLFGEQYKKYIQSTFTDRIYMVKATYKLDRGSAFVTKLIEADRLDISKIISNIYIEISSTEKAIKIREYVYKNMIGKDYNLYYRFFEKEIKAPYKIKINNLIVEELINNGYNVIAK